MVNAFSLKNMTPKSLLILAILFIAGIAGNYCSITVMSGINFLFGTVAVFMALALFGRAWGTLLALIIGSISYIQTGSMILPIMHVVEIFAVGSGMKRFGRNLVLADGLFWAGLGPGAVWLLYYQGMSLNYIDTVEMYLTLAINGILNALLASLIMVLFSIGKVTITGKATARVPRLSIYHLMFFLLVSCIVFPTLIFASLEHDREERALQQNLTNRFQVAAAQISGNLDMWQQQHFSALQELARIAKVGGMVYSPNLQRSTEIIKNSFKDNASVHVGIADGNTLTFYPLQDIRGNPTKNASFAEQQYFKDVKATLRPVLSNVFMAKVVQNSPMVAFAVPIIDKGEFIGYTTGGVKLDYIQQILMLADNGTYSLTLLDRSGKVVARTNPRQTVFEPYSNSMPRKDDTNSTYYIEEKVGSGLDWKLAMEIPLAPLNADIQLTTVKNLALILILVWGIMVVAHFFSKWLAWPLAGLVKVTAKLPEKLGDELPLEWPPSTAEEIDSLVDNFRSMTATLKCKFQEVWTEKERAEVTLHSIGDAVITTDSEGKVDYFNPEAELLTGWTSEQACGKQVAEVFSLVNENTGHVGKNPVIACLELSQVVPVTSDHQLSCRDGQRISIQGKVAPIKDWQGTVMGVVLAFHNVSETRSLLKQLSFQATHDHLTGLPNRSLFLERFNKALRFARLKHGHVGLMFLDLDRFKLINDTQGHSVGDKILRLVGERLQSCLGEKTSVFRLGGDEFAIIIPREIETVAVADFAKGVLRIFQQPWLLEGKEFQISASIGVALYPQDGDHAVTLLKNADIAMYSAKEEGRNNYKLFSEAMNDRVIDRVALEQGLRNALKEEEFVVYYQPQVNSMTGEILGMEALVRWQHPEKGLIPPNAFIPLAEETGLIIPLGEWVLAKACSQTKTWHSAGFEDLKITVNLSGQQFLQKDLVERIGQIIKETGLDPKFLELEITETTAMQDVEFSLDLLNSLREMGIQIAIDDFGTGYSSLNYLRRFPIQTLKIDRSFISRVISNPEDAAIVAAVIVLGKNLNLRIVAEGVETEDQLEFLKEHKCFQVQGYYFSKPVPASEFEEKLMQKSLVLT